MHVAIQVIQLLSYAVGIPLQILTISALLRGAWREYPLVFLYITASFLATLTELPLALGARSGFARLYWVNEGILQILILAVVVGFIYAATEKLRSRTAIRFGLLVGAALFTVISFLSFYDGSLPIRRWMFPWSRMMKVCSTVLDLALWMMLISSRHKDRLLLTLTGAMGIMFTGEAIARSISAMAAPNQLQLVSDIGGTVSAVANNVFLYIWWQAFRRLVPSHHQHA